jgi:thioredoxin-related protein
MLTALTALLCLTAASAHGQEVKWRYDYSAARNEAQKTGRPLFLDFSTEWCTYCKKLDVTTFRDPTVLQALNEQFIPVKLDGNREKRLVDYLKIQAYPTLIMAGPDGKILKTIEGYVDANRLRDHLQEVAHAAANPEWMTRNYQEATRALQSNDFSRAVALLRIVVEDNRQRPLQIEARKLLLDIEQRAQGQLVKAEQLEDRGQFLEAIEVLTGLTQTYAGTQAAAEAVKTLAVLSDRPEVKTEHRRRRAVQLLAQAKEDLQQQQFLSFLDRCSILSDTFADLPEGAEASKLLEQVKANPEWMKATCDSLADRLGEMYLALAETWVRKGEPQLAAECLQRAAALPGSRHAESAKVRLAQIQGQPANQK